MPPVTEVPLWRSEFALLAAFLRAPGRALSREQLLDCGFRPPRRSVRQKHRRSGRTAAAEDRAGPESTAADQDGAGCRI